MQGFLQGSRSTEGLQVSVALVVDDGASRLVVATPLDHPVAVEVVMALLVLDCQEVVCLGHLLYADVPRSRRNHLRFHVTWGSGYITLVRPLSN